MMKSLYDKSYSDNLDGCDADTNNYLEKIHILTRERDKYKALFDNAAESIFIIGVDGFIIDANEQACHVYGYNKKQLIGMPVFELDLQKDKNLVKDRIKVVNDSKKVVFQTIHVSATGQHIYTQVDAQMIKHDNKDAILASCRNITDLQNAQQELIASREQLDSLIKAVPSGIGLSNNRVFVYANETLLKMLGYTKEEMLGKSTRMIYDSQQEYERVGFELYSQIDSKGYGSIETTFKRKDGSLVEILLSAALIHPAAPDKGITFAASDITAQKNMARALEKRFLALTQPLDNIGTISFNDLFNLEDIQKIQDLFAKSTGVASIITEVDGTPITKPSNFCRLCNDIIRKTEKGCANCYKSDAALGEVCHTGPTIQPCLSGGLWDAGASITVGGKHIANWLIGQVRDETQSKDKIIQYAREIGADEATVSAAFDEVTRMPYERFKLISETLFLMAKQLSDSAYQNVLQARFIAESKKNQQIINNYNETLKNEVASQTMKLARTNEYLNKIIAEQQKTEQQLRDAQSHLVQSEKLASIGQLAAGVAHEINSPLGAIGSSNSVIRDNFEDMVLALDELTCLFDDMPELADKLLKLIMVHEESVLSTRQQRQLRTAITQELSGKVSIDPDYLAGFLVNAGLADCYKQFLPLFNRSNSDRILESAQKISNIFQANRVIDQAISQSSRIVFALREYAHSNESEKKQLASVRHSLETAITLYANKLKHGVELILNFSDTTDIACFPGELNQIWTNLIHNAVQAMNGRGTLEITLREVDGYIEVVVTDSGCGIADDIKSEIFKPLFTTKPAGMGTGLGLDIVNRIVKRHNGTISFESTVGKGSSFKVRLPIDKP